MYTPSNVDELEGFGSAEVVTDKEGMGGNMGAGVPEPEMRGLVGGKIEAVVIGALEGEKGRAEEIRKPGRTGVQKGIKALREEIGYTPVVVD